MTRSSECEAAKNSLKSSSTIILVMVIVVVILLVGAIVYNMIKRDTDSEGDAISKKRIVGGLSITSAVVLVLTVFAVFWNRSLTSTVVQCM